MPIQDVFHRWFVAAPTRPCLRLTIGGLRWWLWYYELPVLWVEGSEQWGLLTNFTGPTAPRLRAFS